MIGIKKGGNDLFDDDIKMKMVKECGGKFENKDEFMEIIRKDIKMINECIGSVNGNEGVGMSMYKYTNHENSKFPISSNLSMYQCTNIQIS